MRIAEHIYGSDQRGLIWGYRFAPGRAVEPSMAVTVLALPINMVAGLFGMNVGGIPFAARAHGFFFMAATLIALDRRLIYVVFGKRRD